MPLFSIPLSGLTSSSAALSAISNNLANLNTVGYKEARALFRDLFYQTVGSTGSGDPIQIGAGTAVDSISTMFTAGSVESSGVPTDVAITGDGFFVVSKDGVLSYTRAGNFSQDEKGLLTTSNGQLVMGYPAVNGAISLGQGLSSINLSSGQFSPPKPTTKVQIRSNMDATAAVGTVFNAPIEVFDSLGASHGLTFKFTKSASNVWNWDLTIPSADVGGAGATTSISTGTLTFDGAGNLISTGTGSPLPPAADVTGIKITGLVDGANDLTFDWNVLDPATGAGTVTQTAAPSNTASAYKDGYGSGTLEKFAIGSDGVIEGTFSNGTTTVLGQMALANFANVEGLLRDGHNDFTPTLSSGGAVLGAPGTGGRGVLTGGALELSNVDIATEFARLIQAQRGFQANARAITTFDEITQETINLKR